MNKATEVDLRVAVPGEIADWLEEYAARYELANRKQALLRVLRLAHRRDRETSRMQRTRRPAPRE